MTDNLWNPPGDRHHPAMFWLTAMGGTLILTLIMLAIVLLWGSWAVLAAMVPWGLAVVVMAQISYWLDPAPWRCGCSKHRRLA